MTHVPRLMTAPNSPSPAAKGRSFPRHAGKHAPKRRGAAAGAASALAARAQHAVDEREDLRDLPLGPGHRRQAQDAGVQGRPQRVRADGAGRADQNQERDGPDADFPPLVP
eukprot:762030-Prymnesium_polylepis.1